MKELFQRERASHYESAGTRQSAGSIDLAALCGFVLVAVGVLVVWNPAAPPIRGLVGIPLLFLAPGYALVSVLFPQVTTTSRTGAVPDDARQVTDAERLALSFASSLAVLPILSLPLASVGGFASDSIVAAVSGLTLIGAFGAWIRRRRLSPARRYRPALVARLAALRSFLFPRGSPLLATTNLVLAISVVLALMTGGYALLSPQDGERYTGMQLLSEDENGDLVAAGYPSEIESGESVPITVALENQEQRDVTYELVVRQQRSVDGTLSDRGIVHRATISVVDGETVHSEQVVTPSAEGQLRLVYLLYEAGEVPANPTTDNAYRYTHLWIDVEEPDEDSTDVIVPPPDDDEEDGNESNETDSGDGAGDGGDGDGGDGSDGGDGGGDGDSGDGGGDSGDGDDNSSDDDPFPP